MKPNLTVDLSAPLTQTSVEAARAALQGRLERTRRQTILTLVAALVLPVVFSAGASFDLPAGHAYGYGLFAINLVIIFFLIRTVASQQDRDDIEALLGTLQPVSEEDRSRVEALVRRHPQVSSYVAAVNRERRPLVRLELKAFGECEAARPQRAAQEEGSDLRGVS